MHPLYYYGFNQNPWKTSATRGEVARHFYGAKIPFGATDSPHRVRETYRYSAASGLAGIEDYANDSSAVIQTKISNFKTMLSNAQKERRACDEQSIALKILNPAGYAACVLKWDGQVGWWKDRLNEAQAALNLALTTEAQEKAQADQDAADQAAALKAASSGAGASGKKKSSGSTGSGMTAGGPSFPVLPIAIGVLALGVAAYFFLRK